MSCPDWEALIGERDARADEPSGWSEALAHLDGCSVCRPRALALDPTLVFRRMAIPSVSEADVESMLLSVRSLRRAHELAPLPAAPSLGKVGRRTAVAAVGRLAAAVALVVLGLSLGPALPRRAAPATIAAVGSAGAGLSASAAARLVADLDVEDGSYIEGLDLPGARVYQLAADQTQIVMIVHPSLDL